MRQAEPAGEIDQHVLEGAHVAVGLEHRHADRIRRPVRRADRPVEQRDAVIALEIGRVRQHEIGIGHGLGEEGVGAGSRRGCGSCHPRPVGQHAHRLARIHRRVPGDVRHEDEQRVDLLMRSAHAPRRSPDASARATPSGASQEKARSMPERFAGIVDQEILRPIRESRAARRSSEPSALRLLPPGGGPAGIGFG